MPTLEHADLITSATYAIFPPGRTLKELDDVLQESEANIFRSFVRDRFSISESSEKLVAQRIVDTFDDLTSGKNGKQCNECRALRELLLLEHNYDVTKYKEVYKKSIDEFEADGVRRENLKTNGWRLAKASAVVGNGWRNYWTKKRRLEITLHLLDLIGTTGSPSQRHPRNRVDGNRSAELVLERVAPLDAANSDPFSPPLSKENSLQENWLPTLGSEGAYFLQETQKKLVQAISSGDFLSLENIGEEMLRADFGIQYLTSGAHYAIAESLRLRGDMTVHPTRKEELYDAAIKEYGNAIDLDPRSIKAHRGLGRTLEVIGEHNDADRELNRAYAEARLRMYDDGTVTNELTHEYMRSSRHLLIHHVGQYHEASRRAVRIDLKDKIKGELVECRKSHVDISKKFAVSGSWDRLEEFMAWSQIGAVYSSIGDEVTGVRYMAWALRARLKMSNIAIDVKLISNLKWWSSLARHNVKHAILFLDTVEELGEAIEEGNLRHIIEMCKIVLKTIDQPMAA